MEIAVYQSFLFAVLLGACTSDPQVIVRENTETITETITVEVPITETIIETVTVEVPYEVIDDDPCWVVEEPSPFTVSSTRIEVGGNTSGFLVATQDNSTDGPDWLYTVLRSDGSEVVTDVIDVDGLWIRNLYVSSSDEGFTLRAEVADGGFIVHDRLIFIDNDGEQVVLQDYADVELALSTDGSYGIIAPPGCDTCDDAIDDYGTLEVREDLSITHRSLDVAVDPFQHLSVGGVAVIDDAVAFSQTVNDLDDVHTVSLIVNNGGDTRELMLNSYQDSNLHGSIEAFDVFAWEDSFSVLWMDSTFQGRYHYLTSFPAFDGWDSSTVVLPSRSSGSGVTLSELVQTDNGFMGVQRYPNSGAMIFVMDRHGEEYYRLPVTGALGVSQVNDGAKIGRSGDRYLVAFTGGSFGGDQHVFTAMVDCEPGI